MAIKPPVVPDHRHEDEDSDLNPTGNGPPSIHAPSHNTGGSDALTSLAASIINSGTLDGDRLPAISTTKKGAVPAVTPASPSEFLRDTGDFERILQANVGGLEKAATPQFAGLGIKTPGSDNHIDLIDEAVIGISGGPIQTFNDADKQLEISGCDHIVGDGPATGLPGNGDFNLIYPATTYHYYGGPLVSYDGFLRVGVLLNGKITVRKWSGSGTSWSTDYDYASNYNVTGGIKYQGSLFFCNNWKILQYDGANWTATATPYSGTDFCEYDSALYLSGNYGRISRKIGAGAWSEIYNNARFPDSGTYVHYGARFTLHNGSMFSAWRTTKPEVKILKFDGSTWSVTKIFSETGSGNVPIYSLGAYMYAGIGTKVYRSSDGTTWNEVGVGQFSSTNYCFFDWDGVLLALGADIVYKSTDGVNFTTWKTISDVVLMFAGRHAGVVYVGGYATTGLNYTRVYALTEAGYAPASNEKIWGDLKLMQRFMPNGAAGVKGSLLLSGEITYPIWLPPGAAATYLAGPVTPGDNPVYQVITANDIAAAVNLLASSLLSTTNVSLVATGQTTIYTVPAGKRLVIDCIQPVAGADMGASVITAGQVGALTDFLPATTLTNLNAQYATAALRPIPNTTPLKQISYAAGTVIQIDVNTAAGGATNAFYLFGFLY